MYKKLQEPTRTGDVPEYDSEEYRLFVERWKRYKSHFDRAKDRGIDFYFTFEQWIMWWEQELGPDWMKLRGSAQEQFCMARKKDEGPYHPRNVECVTNKQNLYDWTKVNRRLRRRKLYGR